MAEKPETGPGAGQELPDEELQRQLLALLFVSPDPLSTDRLVALLESPEKARVESAVRALGQR
ncbi:MAG: hypothetical protein O7B99_12265, partial [Planctomycetota bacterium]|nr:hypothetical protein [Planctomycetota bacterium]